MNRLPAFITALSLLLFAAGRSSSQDETDANGGDRTARLERMKRMAESFEVARRTEDGEANTCRLADRPVLFYSDAARGIVDSGTWVWRDEQGRPVAIITFEYRPDDPAGKIWTFEAATLSASPLVLVRGGTWTMPGPAVVRQSFQDAPPPSESTTRRLLQMKQLARRFRSICDAGTEGGRIELRLLPNPVFRFPTADSTQRDGAVFVFAYGTNPEVALLLETVETDDGTQWRYGLAPLTANEATARLDDREIWTEPRYTGRVARTTYVNGRLPTDGE